jgi:cytochrome c oxidase assembly protein subunit 15
MNNRQTQPKPVHRSTPPWLRRFTKLVAFSTLFLIFAGAMVTSTGSGLAVPDWPNTYGWFMFTFPLKHMVGGIFYEHSHRMIAATVGFLTVLQAIWLQLREPKRWMRILGWAAVGAVIAQGILGGLTVIFLLPPAISIAHAGLAEIFFCLNVSIAFFASEWFTAIGKTEKGDAPVAGTTALVGVVYLQILAGALMRHLGAGLAIPDFPLSLGRVIPPLVHTPVVVNFAHRFGALFVTISVIAMYIRLLRFEPRHPLRLVANMLILVVPTQVLLGAYTVWSGKQPVITSLHVMTGALTLAFALILALTARSVAWRTQRAGTLIATEVAA